MKSALALAAVLAAAAPAVSVPGVASAQEYRSYGHYDPCHAAQRRAANNGAVTGGVIGAVLGSAIAGRGSRLGGAVVGGAAGALAGHEVGRHSVKCLAYPARYRPRAQCRWVEQDYSGRPHQFEVCRGADGVWRPSGRH